MAKVAVVGAGAVGGYYGGALARAGEDVALICRGEHQAAIQAEGLRVSSHWWDYRVHPRATPDPADVGPVDLVIYAVKTYQNPDALPLVRPLLGADTVVLPIQNGVESPAILAAEYGWDHVLAGATYIEAARPAPGHVVQSGSVARIAFGEQDGSRTERVERVAEILDKPGIQIEVSSDIRSTLWSKLVTVGAVGTMMTATRSSLVELLEGPEGERTIRTVMAEILAVGESQGVTFPPNVIDDRLAETLAEAEEVRASLQMDFEAGNPLEIDDLLGAVIRLGRENDVSVPASAALYATLYKFRGGAPA